LQIEPVLDRPRLAQMLALEYSLSVVDLTFVPTGWISACYRLTCSDGSRRFLKLQPLSGPQATAASSPGFYLPLTQRLHQSGLLPNIAYPIPTVSGQLWTSWADWRVILHNYIDGRVVGHNGMTDAVVSQLGGLLGRLHRSLPALDLKVRFYDRFEIPFQDQLVGMLAALGAKCSGDTLGQQGLRDVLLPRRDDVLSALRALQATRDRAVAAAHSVVVCHTDLHGENLMLDEAGRLYILDWEGAVLAPREQDLFMFAGEHWFGEVFLPAYEAETGPIMLDVDWLSFYSLRRLLEDVADWVTHLVTGEQAAVQDVVALRHLEVTLVDLASSVS
jgi:spectinomycin phosphotransferase